MESQTRIEPDGKTLQWWIAKSTNLPKHRRNGWVVAWILEEFRDQDLVAKACAMKQFQERMTDAGLAQILDPKSSPRKRCKVVGAATQDKEDLLTEQAQRLMIQAIDRSIASYVSGIRCWAAFNDAVGNSDHFPATEDLR